MTDYESPFAIPSTKQAKCSRPGDYENYRLSHEANKGNALWGPECPIHGLTSRKIKHSDHMKWYEAREQYATAETDHDRAYHYQIMLNYVSESCPPDVAYKDSRLRVKPESHFSVPWVTLAAWCVFAGVMLIIAGIL
jgi:hypothetical protein